MTETRIRRARDEDADIIAQLLTELGYPASGADVPARFARLSRDPRAVALLAERSDQVVGLATAHVLSVLNRPRDVAWLTMLVVRADSRGTGVGRALVGAVEAFALESGCERLSVTTHTERTDARAFYAQIGMEETGRRFGKALNPELKSPS